MSSEHDTTMDKDDSESLEFNETLDSSTASDKYLTESEALAALQLETYDNLPPSVKRRVKALKNLQLQVTNLEAKFYEEVHALECKYNKLYYPIHEKRHNIIVGLYEPTDAEAEWKLDGEISDEIANQLKDKAKVDDKDEKPVVGIPLFWLTAFKNVPLIADMIQSCDEPILCFLIDVKSILLENDPMGFVLEFHFGPNDYFSNSVLTKEYTMKCIPDPCDPFSFEGPEIVKCKGCKIDWKKGKNVTIKQVKKKQKHKNRTGVVRTVVKTVQNESFFHFFSPPEVPEDSESESYDETQALLTTDFEIGHYIRERVVPNAVLFFTGEAAEEEYDDEEEEEVDEEEDDYGEEEESENEATPMKKFDKWKKRDARHSGSTNQPSKTTPSGGGVAPNQNPNECKQQ